ncbi:retrovirus-related pol polyprotein from transposon TNT 1-94 [Tanacetum coccineum]
MSARKQNSKESHKIHPLRISIAGFFIRSMDFIWHSSGHTLRKEDQTSIRIYVELVTINFKTSGLLQPWQTLCKIFSKCLITRVTGWDQPPLQIMKMLYCFVNNIHVDYAELLWEGLYYSLHHPTSSIPYPRFTKIIVSHYMTIFPEISRRAQDKYHNLQDDDIMKNIFNSGRHKDKVGRQRSARLTPPALVPNIDKADEMILQDTLQVSLAEHKSHEEQEARENVALVDEHLASEEIDKMVEGQENVVDDSSIPRNDKSNIPGTRIDPRSDKESPEAEITKEKEVDISKEKEVELTKEMEVEITQETPVVNITNVVIPVNVNDENEEITDEVYELKRREKGKIKLQELTNTHITPSSSSSHTKLSKTNRLLSLFKIKPTRFKRYKSFFQEVHGRYGYLFVHLQARFMPRKSFDTLSDNLHDVMVETLPTIRQKAKEETERLIGKAILLERNQKQDDDFDFWTDSYATDDDEIPTKQVSQDIMEEVSLTINEAKLRKMADEMLRQRLMAAVYFNKIQCFCFEEQRLLPGEQIDTRVFFYIDSEFETDHRMDGIDNTILSYTFFKIAEDKL